jgi:hypothetical protein
MSKQLWSLEMKKCFLFIFDGDILGIPMVNTKAGWEMFVGPAIYIGELLSADDFEIGIAARELVESHLGDVPDEDVDPDLLIKSVSHYGLKSYKSLFRKCLQMSVTKVSECEYKLTPYARVTKNGKVGAEELDTIIISSGQPQELGSAIRQCISYCR